MRKVKWQSDGSLNWLLVAEDGEIINRVLWRGSEHEVESTKKRYTNVEQAKYAADRQWVDHTPSLTDMHIVVLAKEAGFSYNQQHLHQASTTELLRLIRSVERELCLVREQESKKFDQLMKFYGAKDVDDLIYQMEQHILRLQEKTSSTSFSFAPQRVREG